MSDYYADTVKAHLQAAAAHEWLLATRRPMPAPAFQLLDDESRAAARREALDGRSCGWCGTLPDRHGADRIERAGAWADCQRKLAAWDGRTRTDVDGLEAFR